MLFDEDRWLETTCLFLRDYRRNIKQETDGRKDIWGGRLKSGRRRKRHDKVLAPPPRAREKQVACFHLGIR